MSNPGGLIFTIISCMSFTILLALCIKRLRRSVAAANSRSREDLAAAQEFPIPATIVITLPLPEYAVDNAAQILGRTKQDGGLDEAAIAATGRVAQFSELSAGGAGGDGKTAEEEASGEAMKDCAVCLVEFDDKDTVRVLSACSHSFHKDCIDAWLRSHTSCPLCRTDLASAATSAV